MKIFINIWVVFVISITTVYATQDGTKVKNSVMLNQDKTVKLDSVLGCEEKDNKYNTDGKISGFSSMNLAITKEVTCNNRYISWGRFSSLGCAQAIACRKNFTAINGKGTEKLMNEVVAKDYAKNILRHKTELMDRLEVLKRFAESEYGIKAPKCNSSYKSPTQNSTCNLNLLDEVFVKEQENCLDKVGCFNKSINNTLTFKDYKLKNKLPKVSYVSEYNEYRINEKINKAQDEDDALIESLANLSLSAQFNLLTKEQKADRFLKELESGSDDFYKDPVFAYGLGRVSEIEDIKKSAIFKEALKFFEKPHESQNAFKAAYRGYRKEIAERILLDSEVCSKNIDLKLICEEMTKYSMGEKVLKNPFEAEILSSKNMSESRDYDKFKDYTDSKFGKVEYDILINAKRCIAFDLGNEEESYTVEKVSKQLVAKNLTDRMNQVTDPDEMIVTKTRVVGQSAIKDNNTKIDSINSKVQELDDIDVVEKKFSIPATNTTSRVNNLSNQYTQSFTPSAFDSDNNEIKDKVDRKGDSSQATKSVSSTAVDTNINELMKRLAAAEDKVDKMKASNEEAEIDKIKQKKIDEENLLIKELQNQIAELKIEKAKKAVVKEVAVVNPVVEQQKVQSNNFPSSSSFNSGMALAPSRQEVAPKAIDNYDSGRSQSSASTASQSSSKSVSTPILSSTTTNNDNSKVQSSGNTYTTLDGMTSEKMMQTISKKIIELKGTPFYIEEGGMIKEIIAVVKDGKVVLDENGNPIYEKVLKGKVGDKKFAIVKDQTRAPASIKDVGDLKRDQEEKMKKERAEYLKLKNITNGILNKK